MFSDNFANKIMNIFLCIVGVCLSVTVLCLTSALLAATLHAFRII